MSWSFSGRALSAATIETVARLGFEKPTAVQAATIPLFLGHKDVVVEAVTGSGKTLAFLIPIVEILSVRTPVLARSEVGAIVVSPTRELATQTAHTLSEFLRERPGITLATLIGGSDVQEDMAKVRSEGCNVIVGTPGRILDIITRFGSELTLRSLEVLVLDEADRLLNLGFEKTIDSILERLPKQRRTGLFSATMSDAVSELIRAGLRNPMRVTVKVESFSTKSEQKIPDTLKTYFAICEYERRLPFLINFLSAHPAKKSILYFATCAAVEFFSRALPLLPALLTAALPPLFALHGKMEHKKRLKVYSEYLAAGRAVLFCTDLAARGLDFTDVELVVQYEAPQDPTTFVHRCGRTARNGREGEALILLSEHEDAYVEFLANRQVPVDALPAEAPGAVLPCETLFGLLRTINSNDRDLLDRSTRAFVAFIRFYQEHQAKFIFRLKDLEIVSVARSFGLLRLPKMAELKSLPTGAFEESDVDTSLIKYKDSSRNKQRQKKIALYKQLKSMPRDDSKSRQKDTGYQRKASARGAPASPSAPMPNRLDLNELKDDWVEYQRAKKSRNK